MTSFEGLGAGLARLREERGRLARDVAEEAGISRAMLSCYENERTVPNVKSLERILDALDAGPADLERAMRLARRRAKDPRGPGAPPAFGATERALLADALEALSEVVQQVVVPTLRAAAEPEGDAGG